MSPRVHEVSSYPRSDHTKCGLGDRVVLLGRATTHPEGADHNAIEGDRAPAGQEAESGGRERRDPSCVGGPSGQISGRSGRGTN